MPVTLIKSITCRGLTVVKCGDVVLLDITTPQV